MTTKTRLASIAALTTVGALSFTACGGNTVTTPATSAANSGSAAAGSLACPSGKLVGGGSTAQQLAMQNLTTDYKNACGGKATIEYSGTGSGAGIKDFYNGQIDWAGSDSALSNVAKDGVVETDKAKAQCGSDAWNLPAVVGPIAFAYNVKGVDKLVLTPKVIGAIFFGKITTWNDPQIAALNSGVTLPSEKINVFFRSDDSGTSDNVSKYLKAASGGSWAPEHSKSWKGTAGEGKKGSQGVADGVKNTEGGFGYMEWKFAKDSQLGVADIDNGAGAVALSTDSASKGIADATVTGTGNDLKLSMKYTGTSAGAYPAVLVTYEIVCSKGKDAAKTALLKDFLTYMVSSDTQAGLADQGYAPLPAELQTKVAAAVKALQ